jgi:hypothetical protein
MPAIQIHPLEGWKPVPDASFPQSEFAMPRTIKPVELVRRREHRRVQIGATKSSVSWERLMSRKTVILWLAALAFFGVAPLCTGVGEAKPFKSTPICVQAPSRDWSKAPAIIEFETVEDVFAVGDVHGDYERLIDLLVAGSILEQRPTEPQAPAWKAGKAVLVCTGDLIDKGKHSLKVIKFFRALEKSALDSGGRVIVLMGNHEAEFLENPNDDNKAEVFLKELDKHDLKPKDVAQGKDTEGIGAFLRQMPLAAKVNDLFFTHAGSTRGLSLAELRAEIEDGVNADGYRTDILLDKHGLLEARMSPRPWWEKQGESADKSESRLRRHVTALGVKHLVFGHQPGHIEFPDGSIRKKGTMIQKFNGLVFLIDVGMSEAIDYSSGALLHVATKNNKFSSITPDGSRSVLWP